MSPARSDRQPAHRASATPRPYPATGPRLVHCGYDAGKKINGTKRLIAVDTGGLLLTVLVTAASVQDRDAAKPLLWKPAPRLPLHRPGLG